MHTAQRLVYIVLCLFLCVSCNRAKRPEGLVITDNNTRFTITVAGYQREGTMHLPLLYDGKTPQSLVYVLHGAGQSGQFLHGMGFDRLANELGFIVVYPDGIGRRWDSPNDAVFFIELTKALEAAYNIDRRRVYVTGHSAGAIEAYELASVAPGLFAAIAPVAGTVLAGTTGTAELPVSVLAVHTKDDPEVPFDGLWDWGISSFDESVNFWRRINGGQAGKGAPVPASLPIPERGRTDRGEIFLDAPGVRGTLWHGEEADTASLVYNVGAHVWPGQATERIMDFFYNHPARENGVVVEAENLPLVVSALSPVTLRAKVVHPEKAKSVTFFSNTSLIATLTRAPFEIQWKPETSGVNQLRAEVTDFGGHTAQSTLNPFVLVSKPAEGSGPASAIADQLIMPISAKSSSSEAANIEAPCAIDRNFYTRWSSGWTDDEWLLLDLGEDRQVSGIAIFWEIAWARRYVVDLSSDGKTWERAVREDNGNGGIENYQFHPTRTRYVRFTGLKRGTEWGYSFWEIFILGSVGQVPLL